MGDWQYADAARSIADRTNPDGSSESRDAASLPVGTVILEPDISAVRATKKRAAEAVFASKIGAGFAYQGKTIQIDLESQANIAAMFNMAQLSIANPTAYPWAVGFYWRTADNSHLVLDAAGMIAIAAAAGNYVAALKFYLFALKDAIATAADQAALDAIDIKNGWPG